MDLPVRVRKYIEERELLTPGEAVVVGVSGGPDSLCLLDALHRLALEWRWLLHVAHLNHGLRPEAAAEAEFVRAEAGKRGLPFYSDIADVRAYAAHHKQSIEEAARNCRYTFLARVAESVGASHIAVAHTADDQAETVLMHILRGSGLAGLRGMLPKTVISNQLSVISVIRPLLQVSRVEVEAYCAERGLRPVQDPSNADATFFRNRLRRQLLPELETYNPNIREILRRTAEVAAGDYELLERVIADVWKRVVQAEGPAIEFNRDRWLALTTPEQRALLRRAVQTLRADERNVDFAPLEQAVRFTHRAAPGRQCDVLAGLKLDVTAEAVILSAWDYQPQQADVPFVTDGQLAPPWQFNVQPLEPGAWSFAQIESNADVWQAFVDADKLPAPDADVRLRARRPGDRLQPLGLGGHTVKLSDFLINAKVDKPLRDRWPLAVCGDDIVWVAGQRLDERFKVTPETKNVWRLSFTKSTQTSEGLRTTSEV